MSGRIANALCLAGLLLFPGSGIVRGQKTSSNADWSNVGRHYGSRIKISLLDGKTISGQLLSSDDGGLTMASKNGTEVVKKEVIRKITRPSNHIGLVIGGVAGCLLSALIIIKTVDPAHPFKETVGPAAAKVFGPEGGGLALGLAFDLSRPPIYERR